MPETMASRKRELMAARKRELAVEAQLLAAHQGSLKRQAGAERKSEGDSCEHGQPELDYRSCVGSTAKEAVACLDELGFTVLEGLVPPSVCDEVRALVDAARARASDDDYTRIHNPKLRKDLPLPLHRFAPNGIAAMFNGRGGVLGEVLDAVVKRSAGLVEFAAMTILPGAAAQPVHQDVHMASAEEGQNARYLTVFLSLCDVDEKQGPMELWAGTHRMYIPWPEGKDLGGESDDECDDEAVSVCSSDEDEAGSLQAAANGGALYVQGGTVGEEAARELAELTKRHLERAKGRIKLTVGKGDVYLVDPRVLHRGTANVAQTPKQMLYLSFEQREGKLSLLGSTDSMLERLKGKYTLSDILCAVRV